MNAEERRLKVLTTIRNALNALDDGTQAVVYGKDMVIAVHPGFQPLMITTKPLEPL